MTLFLNIECIDNAFPQELGVAYGYGADMVPAFDPHVYAYAGAVEIAAPLNKFLLMRNGADVCAIKFTDFHRDILSSSKSEGRMVAEYDWFNLVEGDVLRQSGHEELSTGKNFSLLGFHSFSTGRQQIKCGAVYLNWRYPIAISFMGGGGSYLKSVKIAITPWAKIEDVKVDDDLHWFSYDEKRKGMFFIFRDLFQGKK